MPRQDRLRPAHRDHGRGERPHRPRQGRRHGGGGPDGVPFADVHVGLLPRGHAHGAEDDLQGSGPRRHRCIRFPSPGGFRSRIPPHISRRQDIPGDQEGQVPQDGQEGVRRLQRADERRYRGGSDGIRWQGRCINPREGGRGYRRPRLDGRLRGGDIGIEPPGQDEHRQDRRLHSRRVREGEVPGPLFAHSEGPPIQGSIRMGGHNRNSEGARRGRWQGIQEGPGAPIIPLSRLSA